MATLHQVMKGTLTKPPPAPTRPDKKPITPPAPSSPPIPGTCRAAAGFLSKNIWVAEKETNAAKNRASHAPLSSAKTPKLATALPITMPGASPLTKSHRTAPRRWCARTLEIDVKMMVAMEVAIAILTARSGPTPRPDKMTVMNGTITMPPPMPSNPAKNPVPKPSRASSTISRGSRIMGERKRCLQMPPDRHPEPGFRWARSTGHWVHLTRDDHAWSVMFQARAQRALVQGNIKPGEHCRRSRL